MEKIIINNDILGTLWVIGWLFTIGYLRLSFWRGVLGIIIWPYLMGKNFSNEIKTVELKK